MAENNNTIITSVYLNATNDYQQRIPNPTQHAVADTMRALFNPMNGNYLNQFMDILVNRIGMTYVRGKEWQNVLSPFKGALLQYGSTIQEIAPKWIRAHSYTDDAETLLKLHRPEAAVWYHSQNRRDKYPISINPDELRTAFTDEYGLNSLVSKIMTVPMNSDNYDEYRIMLQLLAEYENRWGFFKHQLSAVPTDEATGKEFLTAVRTYAGILKFPSTIYNAAAVTDIPVFAQPDELILFVTPATDASVDVNTLASVFHLDKADINRVTKVIVDEFPIPNAVALLTTRDLFVCNDTLYQNNSFYNPETLTTNYWLHHWGVYSISPFVPAILFTTAEGTSVPTVEQELTAITLTADPASVAAGGTSELTVTLTGSLDQATYSGVKLAPDAATYELNASITTGEGNDAVTDDVQLDYKTYVDNYGVLHVSKDLESGVDIVVTATSTYQNPSGATEAMTDTATVTVS